jgi:hypothetical protein
MKYATPLDYWILGVRSTQMLLEAQTVIGLRLVGMAAGWRISPSETARMIREKGPAFLEAAGAATSAAMKGKRPDQIAEAALKPIGIRTRSNVRRLSKARRR